MQKDARANDAGAALLSLVFSRLAAPVPLLLSLNSLNERHEQLLESGFELLIAEGCRMESSRLSHRLHGLTATELLRGKYREQSCCVGFGVCGQETDGLACGGRLAEVRNDDVEQRTGTLVSERDHTAGKSAEENKPKAKYQLVAH